MLKDYVLKPLALAVGLSCLGASPAMADDRDSQDFGAMVEHLLHEQSERLFGVKNPLAAPADETDYVARELATAEQRVKLAKGLKAEFVTRKAGLSADMIAFYPNPEEYSHLIVCLEPGRHGTTPGGFSGYNGSVQRINVETGAVEMILHGMSRCDGIRTTDWGTVLATEENGTDGNAYEILDPLNTNHHWVASRDGVGDVRDGVDSVNTSANVVKRPMLGHFSWEGLEITPEGVVIAGDELRPGGGNEGGAIFKFIPSSPRTADAGMISDLSQSPLAGGTLYALQVGTSDSGQGNQRGAGKWIGPVDPWASRQWARDNNATGYYRPEDLEKDSSYTGPGIRVYVANTGTEGNKNYAEVLRITDTDPANAASAPLVHTFVEGDERRNSFDNVAIQPQTGNVYAIEDHRYGEIHACLPDGADQDLISDGCITIASVVDPNAEPTGFIFDASGKVAYMVVQHGEQPEALLDFDSNPTTGRTDDLIKITGFKLKHHD